MNELERKIKLKREIIQANQSPQKRRSYCSSWDNKCKDIKDLERVSSYFHNCMEVEVSKVNTIVIMFHRSVDYKELSSVLVEELPTS